jgi:thiol-disulfide isomerase/thioredoxin
LPRPKKKINDRMRTLTILLLSLAASPLLPAAPTPRPSPPFVMKDARGGPDFSLAKFRGKIVAFAITQTTCSHCQFLTHTLNKIYKDYESRNVMVVECAFNPDVVLTLGPFMKDVAPLFPMGYNTDHVAVKKYLGWSDERDGMLYIPYMIFIDQKGIIRYDESGRDATNTRPNGFFGENADKNIRAILDKMLKSAAPAPKK